jgi:4-hydroxy-tetrahydrodipicolinate synthase
MFEPKGIIPALVTPFTKSDRVDVKGVRWLTRNAIENGVHSLICVGSLGEFPCLTDEERKTVIRTVVDEANGEVPVIAGVGAASTKLAVAYAKEAADIGVDTVSVLPPFYFNIGDEAVFAHYETVASSVDVPVMIYNFPGTTKVAMSPALVGRLAGIDNIIGIKSSVDSLFHLRQIIRSTRSRKKSFAIIAGLEEYLIPAISLGAKGTVSGMSNFLPKTWVEIYDLCMAGRIPEAYDIYNKIIIPLKELAPPPEPIGALKTGASLFGPIDPRVRLPLLAPPKETRARMQSILKEHGFL